MSKRSDSFWLTIAGYLVVAASLVAVLQIQANDRAEARKNVCLGLVAQQQKLVSLIVFAEQATKNQGPIDPTLPPAFQEIIRQSREATIKFYRDIKADLRKPIKLCQMAGVNYKLDFSPVVTIVPGSTSTVPVTTTTTTTTVSERVVGATGPAGRFGDRGPAGPAAPTSSSTTTTTQPSTEDEICRFVRIVC